MSKIVATMLILRQSYYLISILLEKICMKKSRRYIMTVIVFFVVVINNKTHPMENDNEILTFVKVNDNNREQTETFLKPFIQNDLEKRKKDFESKTISNLLDELLIQNESYIPIIIKKEDAIIGFIKIRTPGYYVCPTNVIMIEKVTININCNHFLNELREHFFKKQQTTYILIHQRNKSSLKHELLIQHGSRAPRFVGAPPISFDGDYYEFSRKKPYPKNKNYKYKTE